MSLTAAGSARRRASRAILASGATSVATLPSARRCHPGSEKAPVGRSRTRTGDHVEPARADGAGRGAAKQRERQGEGGEQQRGGEHPAIPQALAEFLAGEDQDGVHGASRPGRAGGGFGGEADHHAASQRRKWA